MTTADAPASAIRLIPSTLSESGEAEGTIGFFRSRPMYLVLRFAMIQSFLIQNDCYAFASASIAAGPAICSYTFQRALTSSCPSFKRRSASCGFVRVSIL